MHDLSGRVRGRARVAGFSIPTPFAWYAADDIKLANNAPVTSWPDRGENGLDATLATVDAPVFRTNITRSGRPVVRFTPTRVLRTAAFPAITQPNTIFAVWNSNGAGRVLDGENDVSRHILGTSSTMVRIFAGTFLGYNRPVNFPRFLIHTAIFNGANSSIRENGISQITGNAGTNSTTMFSIGAHHNLVSNPFNGDVAEIIVYDRALSPSEIEQVETYLYKKYYTVSLSREVSGRSALDGSIPEEIPIAGNVDGTSDVSGALGIKLGLSGSVSAEGSITAPMGRVRQLSGQSEGISMLGADLERKKSLLASVEAASELDARLTLRAALLGTIQGESSVVVRVSEDIISIVELDGLFQTEIALRGEVKKDGS